MTSQNMRERKTKQKNLIDERLIGKKDRKWKA